MSARGNDPWGEVAKIRSALGLGLRESNDARIRYGSADAAIKALGEPAARDAYETEYDRLRATNKELLAELQDILAWALTERAPLREQEIASIERIIAKATNA